MSTKEVRRPAAGARRRDALQRPRGRALPSRRSGASIPGPHPPASLNEYLVHHTDQGLAAPIQGLPDSVVQTRTEPRYSKSA